MRVIYPTIVSVLLIHDDGAGLSGKNFHRTIVYAGHDETVRRRKTATTDTIVESK